jgi:hypothetical protein
VGSDYGNSPICHSLGKDYNGSQGFHFYLSSMPNTGNIDFTVWATLSRCQSSDSKNIATNTGKLISFRIEIFDKLTNLGKDNSRFPSDFAPLNISTINRMTMEETDYQNALLLQTNLPVIHKLADSTKEGSFRCLPSVIISDNITNTGHRHSPYAFTTVENNGTVDYFLVKEITRLELYNLNAKLSNDNGFFNFKLGAVYISTDRLEASLLNDTATNPDFIRRSFLYKSTSFVANQYFAIIGKTNSLAAGTDTANLSMWPFLILSFNLFSKRNGLTKECLVLQHQLLITEKCVTQVGTQQPQKAHLSFGRNLL